MEELPLSAFNSDSPVQLKLHLLQLNCKRLTLPASWVRAQTLLLPEGVSRSFLGPENLGMVVDVGRGQNRCGGGAEISAPYTRESFRNPESLRGSAQQPPPI